MPHLLKVMGIHGLGDHRAGKWIDNWQQAIRRSLPDDEKVELEFIPFSYDHLFEETKFSPADPIKAFAKLLRSGAQNLFPLRAKGILDTVTRYLRWYAGYVVAWVENEKFRKTVRNELYKAIAKEQPHLVLAHSLGSLICYDALTDPVALRRRRKTYDVLSDLTFVTLGSQIANPFVVGNLTVGRIIMPPVEQWVHLYNQHDHVFTAPIRLPGEERFYQIETPFDISGPANHDATKYIEHPATESLLWEPVYKQQVKPARRTVFRVLSTPPRSPRQRALLVGINEYPRPEQRLRGAVNDVFLISSLLQERGFQENQIRVVLNHRATARGILDRMQWLLDDARPGDKLVFFYSGHGTQLAQYGPDEEIDQRTEALVPYDFDWMDPSSAITDDQIYHLYSQLPYGTYLTMIFDCCHAGGMHRDGGLQVKGISPPEDILHRNIFWDPKEKSWKPRRLKIVDESFVKSGDAEELSRYAGSEGDTFRIGRALMLRPLTAQEYEKRKRLMAKAGHPSGPYLPVILQACRESELAFEHVEGAQSYGAFTFFLAKVLRESKTITFQRLVEETRKRVRKLYSQNPDILGPQSIVQQKVP